MLFKRSVLSELKKNGFVYYLHSSLFHNLGIKIDKIDDDKLSEKLISFFGELVLLIISAFSNIINSKYDDIDFNDIPPSIKISDNKVKLMIYLGHIWLLINAIFKKSYFTLIYLISYQILMIQLSRYKSIKLFVL